jgi:hypothetical protein
MKSKNLFFTVVLFSISYFSYCQLQQVNMQATSKWPQDFNGITTIDVYWENTGNVDAIARSWVEDAVENSWSKYANVKFNFKNQYYYSGNGIRISVSDTDWPHTKGLGMELNGVDKGMVLNFNFLGEYKCNGTREFCIRAISVHEFGHALGIAHEQDRLDCYCAAFSENYGKYGGYYVTPCDLGSVMNYCNPVWSNNGVLSEYDIQGIQTLYGAKLSTLSDQQNQGFSTAIDKLGENQIWENLFITIGDLQLMYNINAMNPEEIKTFKFASSGIYQYTITSESLHTNNLLYYGSGAGTVYVDKNKNYKLQVFAKSQTYPNFEIFLQIDDVSGEKFKSLGTEAFVFKTDAEAKKFLRNGERPVAKLILYHVAFEEYYMYADGAIMVYNKQNNSFFECAKQQAPVYKSWNGKNWAWSFQRYLSHGNHERYTVTTTGEIWSMATNGVLSQFGTVTNIDF